MSALLFAHFGIQPQEEPNQGEKKEQFDWSSLGGGVLSKEECIVPADTGGMELIESPANSWTRWSGCATKIYCLLTSFGCAF